MAQAQLPATRQTAAVAWPRGGSTPCGGSSRVTVRPDTGDLDRVSIVKLSDGEATGCGRTPGGGRKTCPDAIGLLRRGEPFFCRRCALLCEHETGIDPVPPRTPGCEECLKTGMRWVHLRLCLTCGHVGCCDSSPGRHATRHFHQTGDPVVASWEPRERWAWCYVDQAEVDVPAEAEPYLR